MEALAELSGDLADQIAVRERDLASPYSFLQIAELCRSHGENDVALEWAQRGMAEFPDSPDQRLRCFLVEEYRRRGRTTEAFEQSWAAFTSRPALETYRELAIDAQALGEWAERRTAALALLHAPEAAVDAKTRHSRCAAAAPRSSCAYCYGRTTPTLPGKRRAKAAARTAYGWSSPNSAVSRIQRTRSPSTAATSSSTIAGKDKRSYADAVRLIDETIRPLFDECGRPRTSTATSKRSAASTDPSAT